MNAALLLFLSTTAFGFETGQTASGADILWTVVPVPYAIDLRGLDPALDRKRVSGVIDASFRTWTRVEGASVDFVSDPTSSNTVYWESEWAYDPTVMALTSTWTTDSGAIVAFEIGINSNGGWGLDGEGRDLQNAMTHEVGHVLGLEHEPDEPEATMFPTTTIDETLKCDLHWDDEDGVRYLYPAGVESVFLDASCSSTSSRPSSLALLLAAGLVFVRRRSS